MSRTPDPNSTPDAPRSYLIGGSGWVRRVAALREGRRYVPHGGQLVDFSTSHAKPRAKHTRQRHKSPSQGSTTRPPPGSPEARLASAAHCSQGASSPPWASDPHMSEGPHKPAGVNAHKNRSNDASPRPPGEGRSALPAKSAPNQSVVRPVRSAQARTTTHPTWKPAGSSPARACQAETSSSGTRRWQRPAHAAPPEQPHDCEDCECCAELRQRLQQDCDAAEDERQAAAQARRRLEVALARAERDRADFEQFKVEEAARLEAARAEESRRLQRDRRALDAEQRAVLRDAVAQDRREVQTLQADLQMERRAAGAREARHRLELERLRRRILQLESTKEEMQESLNALEAQRLRHWAGLEQARECASAGAAGPPGAVVHQLSQVDTATPTTACSSHSSMDLQWTTPRAIEGLDTSSDGTPDVTRSDDEGPPGGSSTQPSSTPRSSSSSSVAAECGHQRSAGRASSIQLNAREPLQFAADDCAAGPPVGPCMAPLAPTRRHFPSGAVLHQWPDGHEITAFTNGDLKQSYPSGLVEYLYAEAACWQVTHPATATEVFYFPDGKVEARLPGGATEVLLPGSGGAMKTLSSGRQLPMTAAQLCSEVLLPRPEPLVRPLTG